MAAVARISIEVDEKGAVQAIQGVEGEFTKVEGSLRKTGVTGNVVMTDLAKQNRQANDAAQLLGRTLGVQLPRELNRFLATSRTVGPLLAGAFNVAILGGFVVALTRLPGLVEDLVEGLTHWKAESQKVREETAELNKTLAQHRDRLFELQQEYRLIGLEGLALVAEKTAIAREEIIAATAKFLESERGLKSFEAQALLAAEAGNILAAGSGAAGSSVEELQRRIRNTEDWKKLATASENAKEALRVAEEEMRKLQRTQETTRTETVKTTSAIRQQKLELSDFAGLSEAAGRELAERQRAVDEAFVREHSEREEMFKRWDEGLGGVADKNQSVAQQVVVDWSAARDRMADQFVGLFDDITSGNIGRAFQNAFKRLVAEMVANWVLGVRGMQAASAGSSGVLGAVLGNLGGLGGLGGGRAGPGPTPPFIPASDPTWSFTPAEREMAGLPLSAGQGATLGTVLPAGASIGLPGSAGAGGGILSRLGGVLSAVLPLAGLTAASSIGFGSPGRGAISGAGAAFAAGGVLSTLLPFSAVSLAMPLLLPAVGVGALIGWLTRGSRRKKERRQLNILRADMLRTVQQVQQAYEFHQTDYAGAVAQLEQLRGHYAESVVPLHGKRSEFVDPFVNNTIGNLNQIEMERQRRAGLQFGPAQFHRGGFVDYGLAARSPARGAPRMHAGGEVAATLEEGEGVVSRRGMDRLGREGLNRINSGQGGGAQIHIHTLDPKNFIGWLRGGGLRMIQREMYLAQSEGRF